MATRRGRWDQSESLVWIIASAAFTFHLANFADCNATYWTLGAVVGLMTWTGISLIIQIFGAELNAKLEQQTAKDSTTGAPRPMAERGAVVADTLAELTGSGIDRAIDFSLDGSEVYVSRTEFEIRPEKLWANAGPRLHGWNDKYSI